MRCAECGVKCWGGSRSGILATNERQRQKALGDIAVVRWPSETVNGLGKGLWRSVRGVHMGRVIFGDLDKTRERVVGRHNVRQMKRRAREIGYYQ